MKILAKQKLRLMWSNKARDRVYNLALLGNSYDKLIIKHASKIVAERQLVHKLKHSNLISAIKKFQYSTSAETHLHKKNYYIHKVK